MQQRGAAYRAPTRHEALIQAVKKLRTSTQANRKSWRRFCDDNLGGVRGPARLNPDAVEAFFVAQDGAENRGG
eukprot:10443165-Alexandrium_andersonii.AAC.1